MTFQELLTALAEFSFTAADAPLLTREQFNDLDERLEALNGLVAAGEFEEAAELARHLQVTFALPKLATAAELTRLLLAFQRWVAAAGAWDTREALAEVYGRALADPESTSAPSHRALAGTGAFLLTQRNWRLAAAAWDRWVTQMWNLGPKNELARLRDWASALDAYSEGEKLEGAAVALALTLAPARLRVDVLSVLQAADKALAAPAGGAALGLAALRSSSMQVPPAKRLRTGRSRTLH